jgi:hypothetical protein
MAVVKDSDRAAPTGVRICAEYIGLCNEILAEDAAGRAGEGGPEA